MTFIRNRDFMLEVSKGNIDGHSPLNKFGENRDVDTGTVPEDVTDVGGVYVPPTANTLHNIKSSSVQDAGSLVSSGVIVTYDNNTHILTDSGANFITAGVVIGDTLLNDTNQDHSVVLSVNSETSITIEPFHHKNGSLIGHNYRIATSSGTGAIAIHIKNAHNKEGVLSSEFVILNGTTDVPTTIEHYRIERMHTHGVGSNGVAVGTLTATSILDGTVTAQINIGNGSTQMAFIHVPRGKKLYLKSWHATLYRAGVASDAMADLSLNTRLWAENNDGLVLRDSMGISIGSSTPQIFDPPLEILQDEDLWVRIEGVSDSDSVIRAGFNGVYVDIE